MITEEALREVIEYLSSTLQDEVGDLDMVKVNDYPQVMEALAFQAKMINALGEELQLLQEEK